MINIIYVSKVINGDAFAALI